ncbi:MAG: type II toxin-antitoxin system prevent-host-death family antitoxin [Micrococcales bacterium]|nr:type II toxin-antitoxin system prevent-host-death family antitoxin [Micrococcales bacterium]
MRIITATEAARGFSRLLDQVADGESVTITRGGHAIATLSPAKTCTGRALRAALAGLPPLDDEFVENMALGMEPLDDGSYPWFDD